MPTAPIKMPSWLYDHLVDIWLRCGTSPFLISYLHGGGSSTWSSKIRALKMMDLVQKVGRVHPEVNSAIWQISPATCEKLIKVVGPVPKEVEDACRAYNEVKIEEMIRRRRMTTGRTAIVREERKNKQIAEGVKIIREMFAPGDTFRYYDIMPKLAVKNTKLLGEIEKTGIVQRAGIMKSPRSTGGKNVTVWRLTGYDHE